MGEVSAWTGAEAEALRVALRMSLRGFAEHLGVSVGAVASWKRRGVTVRPTPEMQVVLDAALAQVDPKVRQRFQAIRCTHPDSGVFVAGPSDGAPRPGVAIQAAGGILLTVVADGRPVTLPLDAVAAAATSPAPRQGVGVVGHSDPGATADERAYELFVRGCGLLGTNDRREIEAAQALLQRAVDRDPHFARAIAARGYTSWRQYFAGWSAHAQALTDALRDVEIALDVDPDSVSANVTFIRACWDMGWHERALAAGRSVHARHPDSLEATVAFARALNNAGLAQCALPLIGAVLAVDATYPAAVKLGIWCHLMVGDHAGAAAISRDYLVRHPSDANTRWAVALASSHLPGGFGDAIRIAGDGVAADPTDATVWLLLGYLHRLAGDEDRAQAVWERGRTRLAADGGGSNLRARAWLANLHAGVGDEPAALRCVADLTSADPHNGYLRYRLAHVLAELRRSEEAVEMLASAVADGFLSAQLLRQELVLGLAPLRQADGFWATVRQLETNVERCRQVYAAGISAVNVTTPSI
ncbi:MAG: hypothetical protein JXA67_00440 [Micromonosporaceae bacterium]|nr:hypothetical protein [Micromonosporaceae bacterium]